jgi:hypothetical protein
MGPRQRFFANSQRGFLVNTAAGGGPAIVAAPLGVSAINDSLSNFRERLSFFVRPVFAAPTADRSIDLMDYNG